MLGHAAVLEHTVVLEHSVAVSAGANRGTGAHCGTGANRGCQFWSTLWLSVLEHTAGPQPAGSQCTCGRRCSKAQDL